MQMIRDQFTVQLDNGECPIIGQVEGGWVYEGSGSVYLPFIRFLIMTCF